MSKPNIEIDSAESYDFEPFVFDRSDPHIKSLIKAGIPEDRLRALAEDHASTAEELGVDVPTEADALVEKRG